MATTIDYINSLKQDKTNLVNNLVEKGVEATEDETFTELVPKVLNIESGGGDLSEYFGDTINATGTSDIAGFAHLIKKIPSPVKITGTSATYLFDGLPNLEEPPSVDTTGVTNMNYMWRNCKSLKKLPNLDTSLVKTFMYFAFGCMSLEEPPELDLTNATNMTSAFQGCQFAETKNYDFSNVTNINYLYNGCQNLKSVPNMNTPKVANMNGLFQTCWKLESIGTIDAQSVVDIGTNAFSQCRTLKNMGGLLNLGQAYLTTRAANYSDYTLQLNTTILTEESLINVLTNLYDIATAGCKTQKCTLGSTNLAKLTSEAGQAALAQATAYGWTVA